MIDVIGSDEEEGRVRKAVAGADDSKGWFRIQGNRESEGIDWEGELWAEKKEEGNQCQEYDWVWLKSDWGFWEEFGEKEGDPG